MAPIQISPVGELRVARRKRKRTAIRDFVDRTRRTAEQFVARYTPGPSNSGVPGFVSIDQFRLASEKEKAPDMRNMGAWSDNSVFLGTTILYFLKIMQYSW